MNRTETGLLGALAIVAALWVIIGAFVVAQPWALYLSVTVGWLFIVSGVVVLVLTAGLAMVVGAR